MKTILYSFLAISLLFGSCKKGDFKDIKGEKKGCEICSSNEYEDYVNTPANHTKYDVEPLKYESGCNCISEGFVKYLKNGQTIALVKYFSKNCEGWATKTLCVNGDCEDKDATTCKFKQNCQTTN